MSLEARQVNFGYGEVAILTSVSLCIEAGEMVAILGPNGAGKSTLLKVLSGILPPESGEIRLNGESIRRLSPRQLARWVALVSQEVNREVPFSVEEIVRMGRSPHTSFWGTMGRDDLECVEQALAITDIGHLRRKMLNAISSGEFQRVMIALALAQDTPYLLLDEPTAFLDLKHQMQILGLLRHLNRERGKTIITVTHDLNLAAMFFGRILMMKSGTIAAGGLPAEVFTPPIIREIFEVNTRTATEAGRGAVRITLEET